MRYLGYDPWNANGSLTQRAIGRTAASLTAVTITTSANRNTVVPSPFTGQLVFLTDTKKVQVWDGSTWLNITLAPPEPPTSLSATALGTTSLSVSFTAGADNGSVIANYKYALSTNGGSTYGAFTALDPADALTPITISGLTPGTTYFIKLKAVNGMGDSVESSATSAGTPATPEAPTSLSASIIGGSTVTISFTAGSDNGFAITNYQYALSTNGGSSYGSFTALDPADGTSPITITGLAYSTAYYVKLKAVNSGGVSPESAAVSFTTLGTTFTTDFLVVAGGGSGGTYDEAVGYVPGNNGNNSVFSIITSTGGGRGAGGGTAGGSGGSGGGGAYISNNPGSGTSHQGHSGGYGTSVGPYGGGGGGGAGQSGYSHSSPHAGAGGAGRAVAITGSSVTYAGGGGGSSTYGTAAPGGAGGGGAGQGIGAGSGTPGTANTGGGGGAGEQGVGAGEGGGGAGGLRSTVTGSGGPQNTLETALTLSTSTNYTVTVGGGGAATAGTYVGAAGGSGVVILRYSSGYIITIGAGLTADATGTDGAYSYKRITAGSGNVSWS